MEESEDANIKKRKRQQKNTLTWEQYKRKHRKEHETVDELHAAWTNSTSPTSPTPELTQRTSRNSTNVTSNQHMDLNTNKWHCPQPNCTHQMGTSKDLIKHAFDQHRILITTRHFASDNTCIVCDKEFANKPNTQLHLQRVCWPQATEVNKINAIHKLWQLIHPTSLYSRARPGSSKYDTYTHQGQHTHSTLCATLDRWVVRAPTNSTNNNTTEPSNSAAASTPGARINAAVTEVEE